VSSDRDNILSQASSLGLFLFLTHACLAASQIARVCVDDPAGYPIAQALVTVRTAADAGARPARTDGSGCTTLLVDGTSSPTISAAAAGFADSEAQWNGTEAQTLILKPIQTQQTIDVTAARVPLSLDATSSSVRVLSSQQLNESAGLELDDRLRQVAGFQLFRRTSSQVANPTTEGTSLRGLGSTAASRTLVLSDQIPLNDAFGGWIHWDEIPQLAVQEVELVRGGASDLYGSSAIGGVIDVEPVLPERQSFVADASGASEDTLSLNGLATERARQWTVLAATTIFHSNGYILTAPTLRGLVDAAATVRSQSGRTEVHRQLGSSANGFLRGNLLNEVRGNGTPDQTNATRLWRYAGGLNADSVAIGRIFVRAYGDDQNYRQSFSSIAADRNSEQLTRLQRTPSQQFGGAVQWAKAVHALTLVTGADLLDTRARDDETPVSKGFDQSVLTITARQRDTGEYGELLWQPLGTHALTQGWSAALSGRFDRFRDFDATQYGGTAPVSLPQTEETVFDPRLGIVKPLGPHLSLSGSVFRAFRGPTINELYRVGQVGQQTTEPNASLRSERATGFEFGALLSSASLGSLRTSYFWTQVNRPIAAVTLSSTETMVLLQRENLGQLESRGVTAEWTAHPVSWASITGGYQFALSTVTRFQADPTQVGKWTAQVPRNTATTQLRVERHQWGVFSLDAILSGKQFDDTANQYELHGYTEFNAYAECPLTRRLTAYASFWNLLNRNIDAGRTPILTLASPRTVSAGLRLDVGRIVNK
jgi:outer membrane receptor protein involved in Fe transport